jgi:hypothetical protein
MAGSWGDGRGSVERRRARAAFIERDAENVTVKCGRCLELHVSS